MSKITSISDKGIALIKSFEAFVAKPYLCPAKVPTIGYGTTIYPNGKKVKMTDPAVSEVEALEYLRHDVQTYERAVDAYCRDDVSQSQFDALVSFAYNLGVGALKSSTLLKKVNKSPNDGSIRREFIKWINAGGRPLAGLRRRRLAEADLYFTG